MKRRDLIKSLALLPLAKSGFPLESFLAGSVDGSNLPLASKSGPMPKLHREAFVMDGHVHVMTRELL
jgi:membrane dipeptidase